jgi:hypothetical protein
MLLTVGRLGQVPRHFSASQTLHETIWKRCSLYTDASMSTK